MHCHICGNKLSTEDIFCAGCGTKKIQKPQKTKSIRANTLKEKKEVVALVEKAINGDTSVWDELYRKIERYIYYLALKNLPQINWKRKS